MRVFIGCECSGVVRDAFRALGHDAWSCDLKPDEKGSKYHLQGDIFECFYSGMIGRKHWDMVIAHPPSCTYLSVSGLHWNGRRPGRSDKTEAALLFVQEIMELPVERMCIENPVGCISTRIRPADQYIQPYQFGEDASKNTGLWLEGLPLLKPTKYVDPRIVNGKKRWANQTDSGQNRLAPCDHRAADRARTYQGIAEAMALQWGQTTETVNQ